MNKFFPIKKPQRNRKKKYNECHRNSANTTITLRGSIFEKTSKLFSALNFVSWQAATSPLNISLFVSLGNTTNLDNKLLMR